MRPPGGPAHVGRDVGSGGRTGPPRPGPDDGGHFLRRREDILGSASAGYLGAAALAVFALGLERRLSRGGAPGAAVVVGGSGVALGAYFVGLQVVYSALAYQVAGASPAATQALFDVTIMATPALALVSCALLAATAAGASATGLLPRGVRRLLFAGAAATLPGVVAHGESGYL